MKFNAFGKIFSIIAMLTLVFALTFAVSITASAEENTEPPVTGGTEPPASTFAIEITQSDKDYRKLTVSWTAVEGARYCIYVDYEHVAVVTNGTSYPIDENVKADQEVHVIVEALDENDVTLAVAEVLYKNHRVKVTEKTVEPTCTEDGSYSRTVTCSTCKETLEPDYNEVLPATGHDIEEDKVVAPTCTKKGYTANICKTCGYIEEGSKHDEVKATGHTKVEHDAKAPTCTEPGWNAYETCTKCSYSTKQMIPVISHTWNEATCQTPKTCSVCSEKEGKAVDHKFSPDTDPEAIFVKEVCEFCGEKGKFVKVQIPPAHKDTVIKVAVVTACVIVIILAIKGLVAPPSTTPWWKRRR